MTVYTRPDAATSLRAWFPRFRDRLTTPTEERVVSTRFGETHLLVGGPPDAPPVVVLHGALATSAHVMIEVEPLLRDFRVYAVDIVGHSPMSADQRIPIDQYGLFVVDVFDALGLAESNLIGVSYGGFVAIRALVAAPQRVRRASLVVPGGLVSGATWDGVVKLALPMAMYRWFPTEARLRRFLEPQLTELDDHWVPWMGEALLGFKLDFRVPPLATADELRACTTPVQVFGASDDIHFPGVPLIARAREVFPNVVDSQLFEGCRHSPPPDAAFRERLCTRIGGFFASPSVHTAAAT